MVCVRRSPPEHSILDEAEGDREGGGEGEADGDIEIDAVEGVQKDRQRLIQRDGVR